MAALHDYAQLYPMAPLGGVFILVVGLFVVAGSVWSRKRLMLMWIGLAGGVIGIVLSGRLAMGLPHPTLVQTGSLGLAIVVEIIAFRLAMPALRPKGERAMLIGSLAIVGLHFLIMLPAFGPMMTILGLTCTASAFLAWRLPRYAIPAFWAVDGLLKCGIGALLIATSPLFLG